MPAFPQSLIDGYSAFRSQRLPTEQSRYRELSERGQSPEVMVIGCCDSRVAPEAIFDAGPGELFVLRNVAALVPPYEPDDHFHGASAALDALPKTILDTALKALLKRFSTHRLQGSKMHRLADCVGRQLLNNRILRCIDRVGGLARTLVQVVRLGLTERILIALSTHACLNGCRAESPACRRPPSPCACSSLH